MLEIPLRAQMWRFLGVFDPLRTENIKGPQKTLSGQESRRDSLRTQRTRPQNVIYSICLGRPRATDCYDFGAAGDLGDVINRGNFVSIDQGFWT